MRRLTWLYELRTKTWKPHSCVFPLYPFNTDINVIIQNPPHHQVITIWCQSSPHNAPMMSWSVLAIMSVHVPGQLSSSSCSEQRCWRGHSNPIFCGARYIPWHICTTVNIMSELKRNILNFRYEINFKYEGMLSHSFDKFYVVTKFIVPTIEYIRILSIIFDVECCYLNIQEPSSFL